ELAADVGAADAELAGCPQRVGDGPRRADPERRPGGGRLEAAAVPEFDRERALREGCAELATQRSGGGQRHGAILGLTLLTRMLTLPLVVRQFRSQREMKLHMPELKRMQKQYKGDKQKLQQ